MQALVLLAILLAGCVTTVEPVSPSKAPVIAASETITVQPVRPDGAETQQQIKCGMTNEIVPYLAKNYQEVPHSGGASDRGGIITVLSKQGGTFTIIISLTNGLTCLLGAGKNWRLMGGI